LQSRNHPTSQRMKEASELLASFLYEVLNIYYDLASIRKNKEV
jgi:hypothetical protein